MMGLKTQQFPHTSRACANRNGNRTLELMRSTRRLVLFILAAACWLLAGPGGATARALLACSHEAMHHGHHATPTDGPCFCDQMTGGIDLEVSTAVPTPLVADVAFLLPAALRSCPSLVLLPPSQSFAPTPPPPNALG
jgi:hypothetical protein